MNAGTYHHINDPQTGQSKTLNIVDAYSTFNFESKSDLYIWKEFKNNNESAFIYIYSKYFAMLVNYGHQLTSESQLVEDCIQDLFIDLRKNRQNLTSNNVSIKLYLFKALKRRVIEVRRKSRKIVFEAIPPHKEFEIEPSVEAHLIQDQIKEDHIALVKNALSQLTDRQREALYYLYYENLSYAEIQDLMGMDHIRSVRNLVYKAVNALKTMVKLSSLWVGWTILAAMPIF